MNRSPDQLYGLIFDVDGVIADTEAVNARASIQVFAELFGLGGVQRKDFEAGLGRGAEAYLQAAASVHGLELSPEDLVRGTRARQEKFLALLAENPLPPFPGVLELMNAALRRDDCRVAIATSSTREKSEAVLKSARIPYGEMAYLTGSDVTHKKPHPELFLKAAASAGIPPERCVVIEDAPDGIEAAHGAGSSCIAVANSTTPEKLSGAELVVPSLIQVSVETLVQLIR